MRPTTKDTVGLVLVLGTFAALAIHGGNEHQQTHEVHAADVLALVDVSVFPRGGDDTLEHQVVLVEHGRVTSIGPVGAVRTPANAKVVQAGGLYVVPGTIEALQALYDRHQSPVLDEQSFEPGAPADFVLFDSDPRIDRETMQRPRGAVEGGTWYEQRDLRQMLANPSRRVTDGGAP